MDKQKIINLANKGLEMVSEMSIENRYKNLLGDIFFEMRKEAINYTRCSTQLKLVYTSDFCKWLETGFDYYEKTSDFLNKKGYRMTFKELVSKYEQEQNKKALIV
jgi:hypothetical protein